MPKPYLLFAPIGQTPAVLTEFVYEMYHRFNEVPVRVYVPTTTHSEATIRALLLGDGSLLPQGSKLPLATAWADLFATLNYQGVPELEIHIIHDAQGQPLNDIKDGQQDRAFAALAYKHLRDLTQEADGLKVYALLSGGRKTMSAHVMNAFSALARKDDKLFHILAGHPSMETPTFFFPKGDNPEETLHLVEVSVPRLRGLLRSAVYNKNTFPDDFLEFVRGVDEFLYSDVIPAQIVLTLESEGRLNVDALDAEGKSLLDPDLQITLSRSVAATFLVVLNAALSAPDRKLKPQSLLVRAKQHPDENLQHLARTFYILKNSGNAPKDPWTTVNQVSKAWNSVKKELERSTFFSRLLVPEQTRDVNVTYHFPVHEVPISVRLVRYAPGLKAQWNDHFPNLPLQR